MRSTSKLATQVLLTARAVSLRSTTVCKENLSHAGECKANKFALHSPSRFESLRCSDMEVKVKIVGGNIIGNAKVIEKLLTKGGIVILLLFPAVLVIGPLLVLLSGALMDKWEIGKYISTVFTEGDEFIRWKLMPDYPSFANYKKLLFETPQFFVLFWNSMKLTVCILAGQLLAAVPAAWGFAVYPIRGSKWLFALYVVLMLLPFQVTMLSSYLVLNKLSLLNTHLAIILPAVFSTFPVFVSYGGFRGIPPQMLEAARVDGAGEFTIFARLGLPLGKSGLLSAMVLGFLEYWNMMEQPMAFLEEKSLWPLSLYLPEITWGQAGFAFCASVITLIPAVFVFVLGQDYLEQGIIYSGLKA